MRNGTKQRRHTAGSKRAGHMHRVGWLPGPAILVGIMAAMWVRRQDAARLRHVVRSRRVAAPPERVFQVVADPRKAFLTDNPMVSGERLNQPLVTKTMVAVVLREVGRL